MYCLKLNLSARECTSGRDRTSAVAETCSMITSDTVLCDTVKVFGQLNSQNAQQQAYTGNTGQMAVAAHLHVWEQQKVQKYMRLPFMQGKIPGLVSAKCCVCTF